MTNKTERFFSAKLISKFRFLCKLEVSFVKNRFFEDLNVNKGKFEGQKKIDSEELIIWIMVIGMMWKCCRRRRK
uniref:Uncharacterized protein n=1 Tax=Glossina palpalis gambiensis TaxID=67801 RepID=A0A1B0BVC8_9MUSC